MRGSRSALGSSRFLTEFLQEESESGIGLIFTSERLHFYFCPMGPMSSEPLLEEMPKGFLYK